MDITIIGTGYVGLVTGACFSDVGNTVWCVDNNSQKIQGLKQGISPIYEPGLDELIRNNILKKRIFFTTQLEEALHGCDVCFIAVGTPMDVDGSADLQYVYSVAHEIGKLIDHEMIIVNKSTVPVGTAGVVEDIISQELKLRGKDIKFYVVSNPEFLREGTSIKDCTSPDRVIIGSEDNEVIEFLKGLYSPFVRNRDRFVIMDTASAELAKYASNAMLAMRISFMNELAGICEQVGADVNNVRLGMGSDQRIGYSFLYAGCGYGGSCFPKDVQALIKIAKDNSASCRILEEVEKVNFVQKRILIQKIDKHFGEDITGKKFAIWGLSFKPNTDDMREAPSIVVIEELLKRNAKVLAYDPKATKEAKETFIGQPKGLSYVESPYDAIEQADAMVLLTEWSEFVSPDFKRMKKSMKSPVIFDGRNQYKISDMRKHGFVYYPIGKPPVNTPQKD